MKLFGRTGGYYLFWTNVVYFFTGMFNIFVHEFTRSEFIQMAWVIVLIIPLTVKPVADYFNVRRVWK